MAGFMDLKSQPIADAFHLFDRDGDGSITVKELAEVLLWLGQAQSEEELQNMISEVDVDENGTLELSEFVHFFAKKTKETDDELREAFRIFDQDKNGFISATELWSVVTSLGEAMTEKEAQEMIKAADTDGDGDQMEYGLVVDIRKRRLLRGFVSNECCKECKPTGAARRRISSMIHTEMAQYQFYDQKY